jgi:ribonuclease D
MKKQIYRKFDKHIISTLPREIFEGRIFVVFNENEAERAVEFLLKSDILGIDTETKPAFRRGEDHKVALLQVSTRNECFLFRLNQTGVTEPIKRLLEDQNILKVGLSLKDDLLMLHRRENFQAGLYEDLQDTSKELGILDMSLQKLYANIFGKRISKAQRLSNWEADVLSEKQKRYAATDAWACIQLHDAFSDLKVKGDYEIIDVEDAEDDNKDKTNNTNGEI